MVPRTAVVVWELKGRVEEVYCYFLPRSSAYLLVVERAGERLLEEKHDDVHEMMSRARDLRADLVRVGLQPVIADVSSAWPLDSLLHQFVRAGTVGGAGEHLS